VEIATVVVVVEVAVVGAVKVAAAVVVNTRGNPTQISQMSSSVSRATALRRLRNKSAGFLRTCYFA
jgi:hypothetical protein